MSKKGKMITLFQIDKSGSEVFERDYSIALVKNKENVYGINISQKIKDELMHLFYAKQLRIESKNLKNSRLRFKIRFHTAIIILLIEKAIKDEGYVEEVNIEICNDIDGHFHEINDMIFKRLSKIVPTLKKEDIIQTKFSKNSLVNLAAKNFREKNSNETSNYITLNLKLEEVLKIVKK